jgi:hypothetical protein
MPSIIKFAGIRRRPWWCKIPEHFKLIAHMRPLPMNLHDKLHAARDFEPLIAVQ